MIDQEKIYAVAFNKQSFEDLCEAQSVLLNYADFGHKMTVFLDKCIEGSLQLVVNESASDAAVQTLYVTEKTEFR